jgi:hypothetical protein
MKKSVRLKRLHSELILAAGQYQVPAGLVAAVLIDEIQRYNLFDRLQDMVARGLVNGKGWSRQILARLWAKLSGEPLADQSFGLAQMNLGVLCLLVDSGGVQAPEQYQPGDLSVLLEMLLDERKAPFLVAARLRQIIDHWQAGGVDLSNRPDILGTLYSIGLEGARGVHPDPQPNRRGMAIAEAAAEIGSQTF